ncbi:MAG TPA: hypothetical protein VNP04_08075 [Alphaproteobacteria bacterium]|nr:hypothetical protein [Alphaproteobacteria bacterium]
MRITHRDDSDPEFIRELLGISKKAFKRAAGRLLKRGVVDVDRGGLLRVRDRQTERTEER